MFLHLYGFVCGFVCICLWLFWDSPTWLDSQMRFFQHGPICSQMRRTPYILIQCITGETGLLYTPRRNDVHHVQGEMQRISWFKLILYIVQVKAITNSLIVSYATRTKATSLQFSSPYLTSSIRPLFTCVSQNPFRQNPLPEVQRQKTDWGGMERGRHSSA